MSALHHGDEEREQLRLARNEPEQTRPSELPSPLARLSVEGILSLQRSAGNTGVAARLQRERRATLAESRRAVARMPLAVKGFEGEALDTDDLGGIKEAVLSALALGDHGHIQLVMADLRVKDPKGWVEVDRFLQTVRTLTTSKPRAPVLGMGSSHERPQKIERNIHQFWAGGPMKDGTKNNILKLQEVVQQSAQSGTPWTQFLWTSGIVNAKTGWFGMAEHNPLSDQLKELQAAGIVIVDVDKKWQSLSVTAVGDVGKSRWDLSKERRTDVEEKGLRWTKEAKADLDKKKYDKVKWLSDLVRLVAIDTYGGVYMDTDIGPGSLNLRDNQLYHTDPDGEIGHHAPPFRVPKDYQGTVSDKQLGDSPRERIVRHADANIPVLNYFFASQSGTKHLERELAELFQRESLTSGMGLFGRLFVPLDKSMSEKPTPYAPPQQRVTPWAADLAWTTDVSLGEG
jgi:hypothetical protein